jgi:predicted alpha/beta hydrolase family esterase
MNMKKSLTFCKYLLLLLLLLLPLVVLTANAASQSDLAKEKRWEEQIVPSLMVGEAVKLKADGVEFLGLYAESSTDQSKGAVILIHGMGVHPAWPDVIEPLRMELPEHGWHTLSLQMPVLDNEAEEKDYPPLFSEVPARIQAGVDFLKSKGINNVVISGHSTGATMAFHYLATTRDPTVKTFAILSCGTGIQKDARSNTLENFKKIQGVNIVDVYGSEDTKKVLSALTQRQSLAPEVHGKRYQNLKINGAGHFYREKQHELITQLSAMLDRNISQ